MRILMTVWLLAACGGANGVVLTEKDMATGDAAPKSESDAAATVDAAESSTDAALKSTSDIAVSGTTATVTESCMHICSCWATSKEQSSCSTVCNKRDSRYVGNGPSLAGSASYNFSPSGSYSTGEMFLASSLLGVSGSTSSVQAPPVTPSATCLGCLTQASCSALRTGDVCQDVCPNYE